ncbi:hypothetical protein GCM10023093_03200 [Nemorincola caseinilytica]|uniref:Uncharacterized protein n=2 Tax=Nemorincola caseinilytica TaxID=2054315 RepID=A0ABP8N7H3_9BACT
MLLATALHAQQGKCVLKGNIIAKDGPTYPYRLELDIAGTTGKGISITEQDGMSVRMKVNVQVRRDMKVMVVTENAALGKLPDSMDVCYVTALLRWKTKKGKVQLTGVFSGKDKNKVVCYQGTLEMTGDTNEVPFKEATAKEPAKIPAIADTITTATDKITEGVDKRLQWRSPVCTLEVWDGGVVDGDALTILHNGAPLLTDHTLTGEHTRLVVPLTGKNDTFTFVAGDEGAAPPNTAQILLIDGDERYDLTAFNKKGRSAKIVLTK